MLRYLPLLASFCVFANGERLKSVSSENREELVFECVCYDEILDAECNGTIGSCDDWMRACGKDAWPAAVLWFLFVVVAFWRCFRCCCKTCGSSIPSAGCCGSGSKANEAPDANRKVFYGYGRAQRWFYRIMLSSTVLLGVAIIVPGLTYNKTVTDGVKSVGGHMDVMLDDVVHAVELVKRDMKLVPDISASSQNQIEQSTVTVYDGVDYVRELKEDYLFKYNHEVKFYSREDATFLFGSTVLAVFAGVSIVGLLGIRRILPGLLFGFMLLIMTISFLVTALHQFAAMSLGDVCDSYVPVTAEMMDRIEAKLGCGAVTGKGLSEIRDIIQDSKEEFRQRMCSDYLERDIGGGMRLCSVFECDSAQLCLGGNQAGAPSLAEFFDHLLSMKVRDGSGASMVNQVISQQCGGNCTLSKCATSCQDATLREVSGSVSGNWTQYSPILYNLENELMPIATCMTLRKLVGDIEDPLCKDVADSLVSLFVICLCSMILMLFAGILLTLGTKRFDPYAKAGSVSATKVI